MPISLHVLCSKCEDVHKPPKLLFTSHIKSEKQNTMSIKMIFQNMGNLNQGQCLQSFTSWFWSRAGKPSNMWTLWLSSLNWHRPQTLLHIYPYCIITEGTILPVHLQTTECFPLMVPQYNNTACAKVSRHS